MFLDVFWKRPLGESISPYLFKKREARGRLSCHHLKKSFLFAPSEATFSQTSLLETASLTRMGSDHCARVSLPAPFRHGPRDSLSSRGSRTGIPSSSYLFPRNNTCSSNFLRMTHLLFPASSISYIRNLSEYSEPILNKDLGPTDQNDCVHLPCCRSVRHLHTIRRFQNPV